jgi:hypothetical protein
MRHLKGTAALLLGLCACLLAPAAASAAPAPAWVLTGNAMPTNFAPGAQIEGGLTPAYFPIAYNVGAAPTSGPVTITVTLPAGLDPVDTGVFFSGDPSPSPTCDPVASQVVTCVAQAPIHPGHWFGVSIGIDVAPGAEGTLSPEVVISGGGAATATATTPIPIDPEPAPFDFLAFQAPLTGEDGLAATQAGSHPTQLTVDFGLPVEKVDEILTPPETPETLTATEHPRGIVTELPRGLIINPEATPVRCTEAQLTAGGGCPIASQVGTINILTRVIGVTPYTSPLYNMVPPPGEAASLGFDALGVGIYPHLTGEVRSDGDYGLSGIADDLPALGKNPVLGAQAQLWGDPTGPVHDEVRACPKQETESCPVDEAEQSDIAFLTLPTDCPGASPVYKVRGNSWEQPGAFKEAQYEMAELDGTPRSVDGCEQLAFEPEIKAEPTTNLIDSPAGLRFNLHQPQSFDLEGLSPTVTKDITVALPEGLVANPSQAAGLKACSMEEVGLVTDVGEAPIRFDKKEAHCPDAAKLGEVVATTPLLEDPVPSEGGLGALYLAEPFDNPFGSLFALYIVIEDPNTKTVAKLAGEIIPNPVTGQLSNRFEENPQLPIEDIDLEVFEGPRAPLRTPPACGTHTTNAHLIPWGAPATPEADASSSFGLGATPAGGACPASASAAPHAPAFSAGTLSPLAGTHSPLVLRLSREDGSQEIGGVETILPPGLTAKLAGVGRCSEAAIATARSREAPRLGALELASPSCPATSQVGTVDVAAGAGISPFHVQGRVYLAGPYKGAPLSFVIITPALAGPFDLGAVLVRAAAYVDPKTGQPRALTDPLPRIREGVPLDLRSATVRIDRPGFVLNPTSCDPMAVQGTAISVFGSRAALTSPFQAAGCQALGFKPRLSVRLLGGTKRGDHPRLRVIFRPRPGDANIGRASLAMPRSAFLDQAHIRTVCTRVQFAAKQCPKGSIYGHVTATTPLLDETLKGPVYLRSSDNELPDTVAVLRGPDSLPVEIEGVARIDSIRGGIRANLDTVPDAPITKVVVTMQGGRKGLIINSRNLCARKNRATVQMDGQNGKVHDFRPVVRNDCRKRGRKGKGGKGSSRRAARGR